MKMINKALLLEHGMTELGIKSIMNSLRSHGATTTKHTSIGTKRRGKPLTILVFMIEVAPSRAIIEAEIMLEKAKHNKRVNVELWSRFLEIANGLQ